MAKRRGQAALNLERKRIFKDGFLSGRRAKRSKRKGERANALSPLYPLSRRRALRHAWDALSANRNDSSCRAGGPVRFLQSKNIGTGLESIPQCTQVHC